MNTAFFYSTFVILLSCISLGFAADSKSEPFKCYVCSSEFSGDQKCGAGSEGLDDSFLIDCNTANKTFGGGEPGAKWNSCRKIITWVDFDVNDQKGGIERVMRRCGYIEDTKASSSPCVYRGGLGGRQRVCSCNESGCNSAPAIPVSYIGVLSVVVPMFLITIFQTN